MVIEDDEPLWQSKQKKFKAKRSRNKTFRSGGSPINCLVDPNLDAANQPASDEQKANVAERVKLQLRFVVNGALQAKADQTSG